MQVIVVLEELGVPYEIESIRLENIKKKPLISVKPNGRVPGRSFVPLVPIRCRR